jgi:DNA-binding LytR/AlgR family response regulator
MERKGKERKLDPDQFIRVHRAAIVQVGFVDPLPRN